MIEKYSKEVCACLHISANDHKKKFFCLEISSTFLFYARAKFSVKLEANESTLL